MKDSDVIVLEEPRLSYADQFYLPQVLIGLGTTFRHMWDVVVRGNVSESALLDGMRQEVRRLNHSLALADIRMMDQVADASVATPRAGRAVARRTRGSRPTSPWRRPRAVART